MTPMLVVLLCVAIALPHVLRLDYGQPSAAAAVWLSALVLRALTAVFAAAYLVGILPATELFTAVTHWCWYTVVPLVATHLGLDGHSLGGAVVLVPAGLLAVSLLSVSFGLWRAARAVTRLVQRIRVGSGPRNSVIMGDEDVLIAAAGLRRPRVLVSAGALTSFDDEELDAGLEHEQGHIARRHRYILLLAELCRALGRFLPGTTAAVRELAIHLERDADRFALEHRHAPAVLASAICKAAQRPTIPPMTALGGGGVTRRVRELLETERQPVRPRRLPVRMLALAMAVLVLTLAATLPSATLAAVKGPPAAADVRHCVG